MGRSATAMLTAHFDAPASSPQPPPATTTGSAEARDARGGDKSGAAAKRGKIGKGKKDNQTEAKDNRGHGKHSGATRLHGFLSRSVSAAHAACGKASAAAFNDNFAHTMPVRLSGAAEGTASVAAVNACDE